MTFQIGSVHWLKEEDPCFEDYGEALRAAEEMSDQEFETRIVGVWIKDDGDLLALVYQGEIFEK